MALLSCMAAADLELVPQKQALALMEQTLSSVERLEKWRGGHLYNWYDTATERPLEDVYKRQKQKITKSYRTEPLGHKAWGDLARNVSRCGRRTKKYVPSSEAVHP